jgi:hypothetical protein
MLIYMLRAVEQGYYTCYLWTKTDMSFSLANGRRLTGNEKGYALSGGTLSLLCNGYKRIFL